MKISEIAKKCDYEFCGQDLEADSLRFWYCAGQNSIAIVNSNVDIEKIKARCILVQPTLINTDKTIIYTTDPIEFASVKIARLLREDRCNDSCPIKYRLCDNYFLCDNVVIGQNTYIGPNTCIDNDVVIGDNCVISSNVHVGRGTVIHNAVKIGSGSFVGADSFYHYYDEGLKEFEGLGVVIISEDVSIGNNTTIQRGTFSDTFIGSRCKIGNLIDIGHDVSIGCDCKIVSQTGIASNVRIGNCVMIYGQAGIANDVIIGDRSVVYAKSLVTKNIKENQHVSGLYARDHAAELRIQAKLRKL